MLATFQQTKNTLTGIKLVSGNKANRFLSAEQIENQSEVLPGNRLLFKIGSITYKTYLESG